MSRQISMRLPLKNANFSHLPIINITHHFQLFSQGPAGDPESLVQMLIRFIEANPDLHRACLTYEPIWLEDIFSRFKQVRLRSELIFKKTTTLLYLLGNIFVQSHRDLKFRLPIKSRLWACFTYIL